jgi:hypothetical protein
VILVPVLIFLGGLAIGALVGARWLPDLAVGQVGGLAFFLVCGLIGAALGLLGVHIYLIVEELNHVPSGVIQGEIVGGDLRNIIFECGSLIGLAGVVYLLAPAPEVEDEPEGEPA